MVDLCIITCFFLFWIYGIKPILAPNRQNTHYHTTPHWHEKIYNAQYPDGIKINHRTDVNTSLGDK